MATPHEMRRDPRYETSLPVKIIPPGAVPIPGTILNVSRGGMLVALPVELEIDRTYRIELTDPRGTFSLYGEALRLHLPRRGGNGTDAALFRVGFEFVGMDPEASRRLDLLLAEAAG
jgi:hypothetical protein